MPPRSRKPVTFVERHSLWSDAQTKAATQIERIIKREKLEVVRFSFADQHGVLRGKTLLASEAASAMRGGVTMTTVGGVVSATSAVVNVAVTYWSVLPARSVVVEL